MDFQGFLKHFDGELKERFKLNVLNFRPKTLSIQALDMKKSGGDLTTRPILYILKHIWKLDESKVQELFTISHGLNKKDRQFLVDRAVDYIRYFDPHFSWHIVEEMEQNISTKEGRVMPPLQYSLDEAQKKGILKGRQEGRQEVALNLLSAGLDLEAVSKYTGLSEEEIRKLKNGSCS